MVGVTVTSIFVLKLGSKTFSRNFYLPKWHLKWGVDGSVIRSDHHFSSDFTISRSDCQTFMWRADSRSHNYMTNQITNSQNIAKYRNALHKNWLILEFFWICATGSGRKYLQTSGFNSVHQELSIEVRKFTVARSEVEFLFFLPIY